MADCNKEDMIKKCATEGDWDQVLKLYDELYPDEIVEQEKNSVYLTLILKAGQLSGIGKNDEAKKIYETVLTMLVSTDVGENTRRVLNTKQYIGSALMCQNKFEEALGILHDVLQNQIELFGDGKNSSQSDSAETEVIIGNCLEGQGKLEDALAFCERAYERYVKNFGSEVDITEHVNFYMKSLKLKIAAAAANGKLNLETILRIVDYGPNVFSIKRYGDDGKDTVLHRAVRTDNVNIIKIVFDDIVLNCQVDMEKLNEFLNFENSEHQTLLTLAVKYDCENAVQFLLENGIPLGLDLNKITGFGQNALLIAKYKGVETIQNLLLEYNAVLPPKPE